MCYLFNITSLKSVKKNKKHNLRSNNDVIDGNVDEFDEKSDESHNGKSNRSSNGDLLEF